MLQSTRKALFSDASVLCMSLFCLLLSDSQNVWETVQTTMAILQSTVESLTSQIEKERTKTEALELELLQERQRADQLAVEVQMLKLQNISLSGGGGDSVAEPVMVLEEWALDPVMPRTTSS